MVRCVRSVFVVAIICVLGVAHAAPSVAVDLSRLEAADAAAIEQALVMRLLQEGFAIDPLTAEPAIVVAIIGHENELVLSAKSAHFERSRTIDVSGSSGAQLQLELVQKVVELARLAREATPPPPPTVAAVAAPEPEPVAASVVQHEVIAPPASPRWQLGADVGVLSSTTIEVALHARFAIAHGFGAVMRAAGSQPDGSAIAIDEQELLAGASYEHLLADVLALDVGLIAGVRRHHFELAMPLAEPAGSRYDAALALPVRIALRPARAFEISVWGIAKLARAREHANGPEVLWHRDALGLGAGAGVAARF